MILPIAFGGCHSNSQEQAFQEHVLEIASSQFPELHCRLGKETLLLECDSMKVSLDNLLRVSRLKASEGMGDQEIVAFLKSVPAQKKAQAPRDLTWGEASPRLRPQLASADYLKTSPVHFVTADFPRVSDVLVTYVADSGKNFVYVDEEALKKWAVSKDTLARQSLDNLGAAEGAVKYTEATENKNSFLVIEASDGYAAARILSPKFRREIETRLGSPFFAAIPNTNFLVCWKKESGVPRETLDELFGEHPHPLTKTILRATAEGITVP